MKRNGYCIRRRFSIPGAFTLVELLVTVAVIAVLAGLLLPALTSAHERARRVHCVSNLRQIHLAITMYADEHQDWLPTTFEVKKTVLKADELAKGKQL
jgi:prepilin-type N-terminal cleavage/methylation domain-containing protein